MYTPESVIDKSKLTGVRVTYFATENDFGRYIDNYLKWDDGHAKVKINNKWHSHRWIVFFELKNGMSENELAEMNGLQDKIKQLKLEQVEERVNYV